MEILINGRPIEFTLGTERTLGEVLQGLTAWAAGRGMVVLGVKADGVDVPSAPDDPARARPLGEVRRLEIEAHDVKALVVETLDEVRDYAGRARDLLPDVAEEAARGGPCERLDQFLDALPWLERVFERLEGILRLDFTEIRVEGAPVRDVIEGLRSLGPDLRAADPARRGSLLRGRAVEILDGISRAIPEIIRRADVASGPTSSAAAAIAEEIGVLLPEVRPLSKRLEEIAVQIQIGDESAGMSRFADEIGLIERGFRLAERGRVALGLAVDELVVGGRDWGSVYDKISTLLEELLGAFERGDRVLVGDLLEYELSPAAETLVGALEEIQRRIEARPS